jgi:hypothetical protein
MSPITGILSKIVILINRLIDGLDKRTVDAIRQGFGVLVFILAIACIVVGYKFGQSSAKRGGSPMASSAKELFEIDIKKEHEGGKFDSMLETDMISTTGDNGTQKNRLPSREGVEMETRDSAVEPDAIRKKPAPPVNVDSRERISEVSKTGERTPAKDVRDINRRDSLYDREKGKDIIKDERDPMPVRDKKGEGAENRKKDIRETEPLKKTPDESISRKDEKIKPRSSRDLRPMEKERGIIEK